LLPAQIRNNKTSDCLCGLLATGERRMSSRLTLQR